MFSRSFKRVGLHYTAFRDAIREDSRQTTPSRGVTPRKKFAAQANVESRVKLNAANPTLTTPNTRKGLFYTFSEGRTLGGMERSASKTGDGKPWSPEVKVKGGNSAFYSIGVGKGE